MSKIARVITIVFVLITCVGCDQAAKSVARDTLASQPPIYLLNGVVVLQYAENQGAFLSLGADLPAPVRSALLVIFAAGLLAGALVYVLRARSLDMAQTIALAMIAAGGLGNLVDRVLNAGSVVDFMVLRAGPLHTGIFNVADLVLVAGLVLFALASLRSGESTPAGE